MNLIRLQTSVDPLLHSVTSAITFIIEFAANLLTCYILLVNIIIKEKKKTKKKNIG